MSSEKIKIHDISMMLTEPMLTYPKDVPYQRILQREIPKGSSCNVSVINMSAHTGTHLDAPKHYLQDGYGVDRIPLDSLYGPAWVCDCRGMPAVTAEFLAGKLPDGVKRLLLKTDNSEQVHRNPAQAFNKDFVYLEGGAARVISDRGIKLVAIDYISIDKSGLASKPAHFTLLEKGIVIVEGVVLAEVEQGDYFLACGPLKMADADGAPCRAVLIEGLL